MRLSRRLATIAAALALALTTAGSPAPPRPGHGRRSRRNSSFRCCRSTTSTAICSRRAADATLGATLDPTNTQVEGAEYLASTLEGLRANARYSQTVAAGDLIGGSPFLGLFHDEPAVESLNAMGLDVSSVGNHEFDEGVDELLQRRWMPPGGRLLRALGRGRLPRADFPWLAANVVDETPAGRSCPRHTIGRSAGSRSATSA